MKSSPSICDRIMIQASFWSLLTFSVHQYAIMSKYPSLINVDATYEHNALMDTMHQSLVINTRSSFITASLLVFCVLECRVRKIQIESLHWPKGMGCGKWSFCSEIFNRYCTSTSEYTEFKRPSKIKPCSVSCWNWTITFI